MTVYKSPHAISDLCTTHAVYLSQEPLAIVCQTIFVSKKYNFTYIRFISVSQFLSCEPDCEPDFSCEPDFCREPDCEPDFYREPDCEPDFSREPEMKYYMLQNLPLKLFFSIKYMDSKSGRQWPRVLVLEEITNGKQ